MTDRAMQQRAGAREGEPAAARQPGAAVARGRAAAAQRRLSETINTGPAVTQLAAIGAMVNARAGVVQRGGDDDAGASASTSSSTPATTTPAIAVGIAPVQGPGAEAQRLLAAMAAMRGQPVAAPNVAAGGSGAAVASAAAAGDSAMLSNVAGAEASGRRASALMVGQAPPLRRQPSPPAAGGAGGAAAAPPPRHSLANLLYSSLSPAARHSAERSLYFRDGTRIRLMHPDGPHISDTVMDRRAFVRQPDGSFHSGRHYASHDAADNRQAITEPASMGAEGRLFEISDRHIHPSRGWPGRETGIRDDAHLGRIVAAAQRAMQAIGEARDQLADARSLLDSHPGEPARIEAVNRAKNRLRMRIARGNLAIRVAYGGRRLNPNAAAIDPNANAAAGGGAGGGNAGGSAGAPASHDPVQRPIASASAASGSGAGGPGATISGTSSSRNADADAARAALAAAADVLRQPDAGAAAAAAPQANDEAARSAAVRANAMAHMAGYQRPSPARQAELDALPENYATNAYTAALHGAYVPGVPINPPPAAGGAAPPGGAAASATATATATPSGSGH